MSRTPIRSVGHRYQKCHPPSSALAETFFGCQDLFNIDYSSLSPSSDFRGGTISGQNIVSECGVEPSKPGNAADENITSLTSRHAAGIGAALDAAPMSLAHDASGVVRNIACCTGSVDVARILAVLDGTTIERSGYAADTDMPVTTGNGHVHVHNQVADRAVNTAEQTELPSCVAGQRAADGVIAAIEGAIEVYRIPVGSVYLDVGLKAGVLFRTCIIRIGVQVAQQVGAAGDAVGVGIGAAALQGGGGYGVIA